MVTNKMINSVALACMELFGFACFLYIIIDFTMYLLFSKLDYYSLHINCGGKETNIGGIRYEADQDAGGAAKFVPMADNRWGISSTGDLCDVITTSNDSIANKHLYSE